MMVRKRKNNSHSSKTVNGLIDPKFHYKCYVHLENCDFSKQFESLKIRKQHGQVNYIKNVLSKVTSKKLDEAEVDQNNVAVENAESVQVNEPNKIKKVRIEPESPTLFDHKNKNEPQVSNNMSNVNNDEIRVVERKFLRARKQVNYKEKKSIGTPDISNSKILSPTEKIHIPIYKKAADISVQTKKRKGDLYDFIPESDDDKDSDVSFKINLPVKRKRKKVEVNRNISSEKISKFKMKENFERVNYNDKINGILNKFADKIQSKTGCKKVTQSSASNKRNSAIKDQNKNSNKPIADSVFNSTMLPESNKVILLDDSIIVKRSGDSIFQINVIDCEKKSGIEKDQIPQSENSSFNSSQENNSNSSSNSVSNLSVRSFDGSIDNFFGFGSDINQDKGEEAPNFINIIQNAVINKSVTSNRCMSTPKNLPKQRSWRFNSSFINRNPHYIDIKKNSLPSLNQEAVLDHTFDERIGEVNKTILIPSNTKNPRQQSILKYIETSKEHSENHNFSQSLYDIDELSPVKNKDVDKENSLEKKKLCNGKQRARRNILGLINDVNVSNEIPLENEKGMAALRNSSSPNKSSIEKSDFGFDTLSEREDQICKEKGKPFRLEFTYQKRNKPNKLPEKMNRPVRDSEVQKLVEEDPGFDQIVDQDGLDCRDLRLFEDVEQSPKATNNFQPRTKKNHDQQGHKNKAPQNKLSKEAKEWIKQFNQMCDEVEQEQLEIV